MYDYLDDRQTKRLKELVPYEILAPDADEIIKELERLNNIINELEKVIQENKFWIYNDVLETRENFEVIDVEYILDKLKALKENK